MEIVRVSPQDRKNNSKLVTCGIIYYPRRNKRLVNWGDLEISRDEIGSESSFGRRSGQPADLQVNST